MFVGDGGFPKLKGRAAEVKCIGKPLAAVFLHFMSADDPIHRLVYLGLTLLCKLEDLIAAEESFAFTSPSHAEFVDSTYSFLAVLTKLCHHFHDDSQQLFHFTIKCHYLLHIAFNTKWVHPALSWCYSGED